MSKNTFAALSGTGCLERHSRTQTIFFGVLQFKRHRPRYRKTPLLACGVQWYGYLGCNPRAQTRGYRLQNLHPKQTWKTDGGKGRGKKRVGEGLILHKIILSHGRQGARGPCNPAELGHTLWWVLKGRGQPRCGEQRERVWG